MIAMIESDDTDTDTDTDDDDHWRCWPMVGDLFVVVSGHRKTLPLS